MSGNVERALEVVQLTLYDCQYNSQVDGRLRIVERELEEALEGVTSPPLQEPDLEPVLEGDDLSDEDE